MSIRYVHSEDANQYQLPNPNANPTLDLLNPKSVCCDTVLKTTTVPCFKSFPRTHTYTYIHPHTGHQLVGVLRHFQHKWVISCHRCQKCKHTAGGEHK